MIQSPIQQQILRELLALSLPQQQHVLTYIQSIAQTEETELPKGISGSSLLKFAGTIDREELGKMQRAIHP